MNKYQEPCLYTVSKDLFSIILQSTGGDALLADCDGICGSTTLGVTCDPTGIFVNVLVPAEIDSCANGKDFPCTVIYNGFAAGNCAAFECPAGTCESAQTWRIQCDYPAENDECSESVEPSIQVVCGGETSGCDFLFVGT